MTRVRLEAFSDGVIAVAITLLVLDITVPAAGSGHSLAHELGQRWPTYAAYVISFLTVGIIWINHHVMIGRVGRPDHSILILNLFLLMTIAVIPFATSLMATCLRTGYGERLAAGVYGGTMLAMALAFSALNGHILLRRAHLLGEELPLAVRRQTFRRATTGIVPYLLATALAPVSPYATLGICAAIAVFYTLPAASSA